MSKGVNKVILIGNLGGDPEVRTTPSGLSVANVSLATNDTWKDKQTGELHVRTEWHKVCFFDKLAQIAKEYLRKGSKIYLEGSIRTKKWQDQAGNDRYTTEITANTMQMLDSKLDSRLDARLEDSSNNNNNGNISNKREGLLATNKAPALEELAIQDDDIPF